MLPKFLNTLNIKIRATLHHDTNIKNFEFSELSLKSNDFFNRANVAIFDTKNEISDHIEMSVCKIRFP